MSSILTPVPFGLLTQNPLDDRYYKADIAARDAIPLSVRFPGLMVYVLDAGNSKPKLFTLDAPPGDLNNNNLWKAAGGMDFSADPANTGDIPIYNADNENWDITRLPIYYTDTSTWKTADTEDTLEELKLRAKVAINSDVDTAYQLLIKGDYAVKDDSSNNPVFKVDAANNKIVGKASDDNAQELFKDSELVVKKWFLENTSGDDKYIDLEGNMVSLPDWIQIYNKPIVFHSSTENNPSATDIKFYQTLTTDYTYPGAVIVDTAAIIKSDADTVTEVAAFRASITNQKSTDVAMHAFKATTGDIVLDKDGVSVGNPYPAVTAPAYYNITRPLSSDLPYKEYALKSVVYNDTDSKEYTTYIKSTGDASFRDITAEDITARSAKAYYKTNGTLESMSPNGYWGLLGTIPTASASNAVTWIIDYSLNAATTVGTYIVKLENGNLHITNILDPNTLDDTKKLYVAGEAVTGGYEIYMKTDASPGTATFDITVYGNLADADLPNDTVTQNVSITPGITATEVIGTSFWKKEDSSNVIYNTNTDGAAKVVGKFYNGKIAVFTPDDVNYTYKVEHTGSSSTTLQFYVNADGNLGIHTNAPIGDEDVTIGGKVGITTLQRLGTNTPATDSVPLFDGNSFIPYTFSDIKSSDQTKDLITWSTDSNDKAILLSLPGYPRKDMDETIDGDWSFTTNISSPKYTITESVNSTGNKSELIYEVNTADPSKDGWYLKDVINTNTDYNPNFFIYNNLENDYKRLLTTQDEWGYYRFIGRTLGSSSNTARWNKIITIKLVTNYSLVAFRLLSLTTGGSSSDPTQQGEILARFYANGNLTGTPAIKFDFIKTGYETYTYKLGYVTYIGTDNGSTVRFIDIYVDMWDNWNGNTFYQYGLAHNYAADQIKNSIIYYNRGPNVGEPAGIVYANEFINYSERSLLGGTNIEIVNTGSAGQKAINFTGTLGEQNVQSDWNETNTASDAYIKNVPSTFPPATHTHSQYTARAANETVTGSWTFATDSYPTLTLRRNSDSAAALHFTNSTGNKGVIYGNSTGISIVSENNGEIRLSPNGNSAEGIFMDGDNDYNVGIAKDNPTEKLEVGGNVKADDFILSSDISVKENIQVPIVDAIDSVEIVKFNFKEDKAKRTRYGVIAQDLEQYYPEMVTTNKYGIKSVSYIDFLVAKVESLSRRIKELEDNYGTST